MKSNPKFLTIIAFGFVCFAFGAVSVYAFGDGYDYNSNGGDNVPSPRSPTAPPSNVQQLVPSNLPDNNTGQQGSTGGTNAPSSETVAGDISSLLDEPEEEPEQPPPSSPKSPSNTVGGISKILGNIGGGVGKNMGGGGFNNNPDGS